ncbi:hypothetical protein BASA81_002528 [Batrachochytrium salamandrivorans]|nr:hypothetical protein BASA81_002528 [Batrachochytrium salamandrivorans]
MKQPNAPVPVVCPGCGAIFPLPRHALGLAATCNQCQLCFLARSKPLGDAALIKESLGQNDEKLFRGRLMFHQPQLLGSTPPRHSELLQLDNQVEVSYDLPEIREQRCNLHVVLDDIRSQWNVGSMFRTADASGWGSLTLCGITASPPSSGVIKTALGASEYVPWQYKASCKQALEEQLRTTDTTLVALELTNQSHNLFDFVLPSSRVVLVVGNEVSGVSPEALNLCSHKVAIPMTGRKGSLNVAVAFGIASFALAQKWRQQQQRVY